MKPARIQIDNFTINMHLADAQTLSGDAVLGQIVRSASIAALEERIKPKAPANRFEFALDGASVIDHQTGLMWTADTVAIDKKWGDAKMAAAAVTLGSYDDWRLPEQSELLSIVDYGRHNPAINTDFFKCVSGYYWSNTPYANPAGSGCAWLVGFGSGDTDFDRHSSEARVRAVRSVASSARQ